MSQSESSESVDRSNDEQLDVTPAPNIPAQSPRKAPNGCSLVTGVVLLVSIVFNVLNLVMQLSSQTPTPNPPAFGTAYSDPDSGRAIAFWQTVSGDFMLPGSNDWLFIGSANQIISVSLTVLTPNVDVHLFLIDSDGREVDHVEMSRDDANSLLVCVRLPHNGRYKIRVTSYSDDDAAYQLALRAIEGTGLDDFDNGGMLEGSLNSCPASDVASPFPTEIATSSQ